MIPWLHSILKGILDAKHYIKTQAQGQPLSTCQHDESISPAFIQNNNRAATQAKACQGKKKKNSFRRIAWDLIGRRRAVYKTLAASEAEM